MLNQKQNNNTRVKLKFRNPETPETIFLTEYNFRDIKYLIKKKIIILKEAN